MAHPIKIYLGSIRKGDKPEGLLIEYFAVPGVDEEGEVCWHLESSHSVTLCPQGDRSFGEVLDDLHDRFRGRYKTFKPEQITVSGPYVRIQGPVK